MVAGQALDRVPTRAVDRAAASGALAWCLVTGNPHDLAAEVR